MREVVEGEAVGADGARAEEGDTFRAEEDDAPEGAEGTEWTSLGARRRRLEANEAAVAEVQIGQAARGRGVRQGRAGGRCTASRAMFREETGRRGGGVGVGDGGGGGGAGCGLHHGKPRVWGG